MILTEEYPFPSSLFVAQTFQFVPHPFVGARSTRPHSYQTQRGERYIHVHMYTTRHGYTQKNSYFSVFRVFSEFRDADSMLSESRKTRNTLKTRKRTLTSADYADSMNSVVLTVLLSESRKTRNTLNTLKKEGLSYMQGPLVYPL